MSRARVLAALFLLAVGIVAASATPAAERAVVRIQGPSTHVQLVELYTSEGCSSCPPADAWLARLERDGRLWQRTVPIALHVDYWDRLGWRDRFASNAHSARQRAYERAGHSNGVYTPGWFVDGKEWRGWFAQQTLPEPSSTHVGALHIEIEGNRVAVRTDASALAQRGAVLHVALLGAGLTSAIRRGENQGRTLQHSFVVLQHARAAFNRGAGAVQLARFSSEPVPRRAIAAWVTAADGLTPLQAAGGWLPAGTL